MRMAFGLLGLILALLVVSQLAKRVISPAATSTAPLTGPPSHQDASADGAQHQVAPTSPPQTPQQFKQAVEGLMATPRPDEPER
jgi:hypothetical protein